MWREIVIFSNTYVLEFRFFSKKVMTQKTFPTYFSYSKNQYFVEVFCLPIELSFFWNNFLFVKGPQAKWFFSLRCLSFESIEWVGAQQDEIFLKEHVFQFQFKFFGTIGLTNLSNAR